MNLETFFEKFNRFAETPDAVVKIREMILDFAAQGLLTDRKPNDGRASDIVKVIANERARLTSKKLIRKQAVLPDLDCDTLPFAIPQTWTWVRLGDCVPSYTDDFVDGPFGSNLKADEYIAHGTPIVRLKNIGRNKFKTKDIKYISHKKAEELDRHNFKPGDLLLNKLGEPVGKCCIAPDELGAGIIVADVIRLRLSNELFEPRLVALIINSPTIARQLLSEITGITRDRVSLKKLRNLTIPLPPLPEQKRIVAKVDELMALCDQLEAQQQERETRHAALARASLSLFAGAPTPANLRFIFQPSYDISPEDLRKSILTLAVQGKLVLQDPNDQPAEEVLADIAADVAKAVRAKRMRSSRPTPPYENEFPFDLPSGWAWAPLGTLTAPENGAMCDGPFGSKLKTEHYIPTKGYAVLRLGNIGVGYFIHGKEGHISREHFESLPSNQTAPGDLLVAGLADPLIRCCEVPPDIGPAVNKSDCFRVRLSKRVERSYVRHYLNSPIAKAFAAEENHGMTRERINLANAKALPVSVPPLAEQRRIVAKVEQLMALVDELETRLVASRKTGVDLMEAVVAELTANA